METWCTPKEIQEFKNMLQACGATSPSGGRATITPPSECATKKRVTVCVHATPPGLSTSFKLETVIVRPSTDLMWWSQVCLSSSPWHQQHTLFFVQVSN